MKGDDRRLNLFEKYACNWTLVSAKYPWYKSIPDTHRFAVLCPLCLSIFNSEALNQQSDNPLTLEHIPPHNLGGKPIILTCKKCNNQSGQFLDHNIMEHIQTEPFLRLQENSEITGTTSLNHSGNKAITSRTIIKIASNNTLVFRAQIGKGEWREKQLSKMDINAPISIDFKFKTPSAKLVHIALLRIAYLLAFAKFGHSFILNELLNTIRSQIINPAADILEPFGSMVKKDILLSDGIYVTKTPFEEKCFLVVFSVKEKNELRKACVFLPSPFSDSVKFFKRFTELSSQKFILDVSEKFIDIDFLTNVDNVLAFKNAFK